jgi:D-glycero-alpha-D-manno-heptose-7-phosphate kinase
MIVVGTPLRLSFLGGGTDFPAFYRKSGGAVVSTAIDKYIYVIIKKRFDDLVVVNYSQRETVSNPADLKHELIREAMRITGVEGGVEITTLADVPSTGTGLGSSSTVTVGALQALYTYQGIIVASDELARQACEIELEFCRKPIGKQDQYIAAYGGIRLIEFLKDDRTKVSNVLIPEKTLQELTRRIMLFYTNRTRSAASVLKEQSDNIDDRYDLLCQLRDMAYAGAEHLAKGDLDALGRLMHEGWSLKKQLASGVSDSGINDMYDTARQAGALGGKIAGAGAGGFLLLYCPLERQDPVRKALGHLRELPVGLERDGSKVILNIRRQ